MDEIILKFKADQASLDASFQELSKTADKAIEGLENKPIKLNNLSTALKEMVKLSGEIDLSQVDKEIDKIVKDIPKLKELVAVFKGTADQMDRNSQEFAEFSKIIKSVEKEINILEGGIINTGKATKTATTELRQFTQTVINSGDVGAESFRNQAKEAGKLKDSIGDAKEAIKAYSSDTFALDAGVDILSQSVGLYQGLTGAMALFGGENEEVQKSIERLVAVQNLANSIQQAATFITGQSAGKLALLDGWNKAVTASQTLLTVATGASTAATRAFGTALVATGVGAFIVGLGALVSNWDNVKRAITGTTKEMELYNDINNKVSDDSAKEISRLRTLTAIAQSNTQSLEQRKNAVVLLKKEFPDYFNGLSEEKILYGDISKTVDLATQSIIKKARAQAIQDKLVESIKNEYNAVVKNKELQESLAKNDEKGFFDKNFFTQYSLNSKIKANAKEYVESKKTQDALLNLLKTNATLEIQAVNQKQTKLNSINSKSNEKRGKDNEDWEKQYESERLKREEEYTKKRAEALNEKIKEAQKNVKPLEVPLTISDNNIPNVNNTDYLLAGIKENKRKEEFEKTKAQISELLTFAQNGILLQLGLNPQDVERVKTGVLSAMDTIKASQKILDDVNATAAEQSKARMDNIKAVSEVVASGVTTISNALFSAEKQRISEETQALNEQQEEEIRLAGDNEQKKDIIRQKYDLKKRELKRKEAEADKRKAIFDATVGTAVAVIQAGIVTPQAILAAILGGIQIALIAAQPIPKFAKGGRPKDGLQKGRPHSAGGILGEFEGDEFITKKSQAIKPENLGLLEAINASDELRDRYINSHYVLPAIKKLESNEQRSQQASILEYENNLIARVSSATLRNIHGELKNNTEAVKRLANKDMKW